MTLHPDLEQHAAAAPVSHSIQLALQENEDWSHYLAEHTQDLLCTHDLTGKLLAVNAAPARLLGYAVEELLRIPIRELVAPELRGEFDDYLNEIKRCGEARGLLAMKTRTGERRIWRYFNTLRNQGSKAPIVRCMAHDVTEQIRAERLSLTTGECLLSEVRDSDLTRRKLKLYRTLIDQSNDVIELVDPQTLRFLDANEKACAVLGYSRDQLLSLGILDINPEMTASSAAALKETLKMSGSLVMRSVHRRQDGSTFPVEMRLQWINIHGEYIVAVVRDLTEREQVEGRLREYERVLDLQEAKEKLSEEKVYLEQAIDSELGFGEIIGRSQALKEVMQNVARVAPSDATVLLLGETGTGKELVARALHRLSGRKDTCFIKLNCAAIPSGLLESELFGHEKGAFTGAVARKIGRLELAEGGTLFLDEIGEIPLELQPKLLRVLQDQEFERLGGTHTIKVNFRLLAATNRDLKHSVSLKQFRSDLFYRLNVFPIRLPPLRERRDDIPLLIEHFVGACAARMNKPIPKVPAKTMEALVRWNWPGNIRELENFVERSVILSPGGTLRVPLGELMLQPEERNGGTLQDKERERILRALRECHGRLGGPNGAAARLGLKRTTLQSKLVHLGINPGGYRI